MKSLQKARGRVFVVPTFAPRRTIMNLAQHTEFPPPDFVAFLAQRSGLSHEAAQHRLESWLGEYHADAQQRRPAALVLDELSVAV